MITVVSDEVWNERTAAGYDESAASRPSAAAPRAHTCPSPAWPPTAGRFEFAIGTGRVAIALRERGLTVAGIEKSAPMADVLRAKPTADEIEVVIGDMAAATAPGKFDLVYVVYNAISCLLTQAEQVACFRNAARHLRPGGQFVVELWVPDLQRLPPGAIAQPFHISEHRAGFDTYDLLHQRVVSHHYWFGDGKVGTFQSPHRYVWPSELDLMGELAGLSLAGRWADWTRAEFTADSRSHVSVWAKPAGDLPSR